MDTPKLDAQVARQWFPFRSLISTSLAPTLLSKSLDGLEKTNTPTIAIIIC